MNDREKYQRYLASREWGLLKKGVYKRAAGLCERCRLNRIDAVHHLTYIRKYFERLEDLQGLCNECHEFTHGLSDVDPRLLKFWSRECVKRDLPYLYLAGKVKGRKHEIADQAGVRSYTCTDGGDHSEHRWGWGRCDLRDWLSDSQDFFDDEIAKCRGMLAYIDCNTSFGSLVEIGFASAMRMPCFLVFSKVDDNPFANRSFFDTYWFACSMPAVTGCVVDSDESAAAAFRVAEATIWAI